MNALQESVARVYGQLGWGHREVVYQRALVYDLLHGGHWVQEEVAVPITYHLPGGPSVVVATERADLVIGDLLVVELKVGSAQGAPLEAAMQQAARYRRHLVGVTLAAVVFFGKSSVSVRALP